MRTEDLRGFLVDLLASLFPRLCPLCRRALVLQGDGFCTGCTRAFPIIRDPLCSRCGYPLAAGYGLDGALCPACLPRRSALPGSCVVRSVALYASGIRKAVLDMKYQGSSSMAHALGILLRNHYGRLFGRRHGFDRILPVPLHPRRLREREFNQSVFLARPLARRLQVPLDLDSAERARHTPSQSGSTEAERRRNLKGAFRVRRAGPVQGASILLVDDVVTTGATLEELAKCLISAGARRVAALTLARSPRQGPGLPTSCPAGRHPDRPWM